MFLNNLDMKYFKQNYASGSHDWTVYGGYEESDITPDGDIDTTVYSVDCEDGKYYYECYEDYFEPEEIEVITEDEYRHVVEQIQKVDELQSQINDVLKALI